jgi:hypothetical protein
MMEGSSLETTVPNIFQYKTNRLGSDTERLVFIYLKKKKVLLKILRAEIINLSLFRMLLNMYRH